MVAKTELFVCSLQKEQRDVGRLGLPSHYPHYEIITSRPKINNRGWTKAKVVMTTDTSRYAKWEQYRYTDLGVIACKGLNEWK